MTRTRWAATVAAVLGGVLVASPVHAIEARPLIQEPHDRGAHTIVIDAPRDAAGLRPVARLVDRRVDGLRIVAHRGATCRERVTCIRVSIRDYGVRVQCAPGSPVSLTGCAQLGGLDPFMRINSHWFPPARGTMCHELLHTLGLRHHDGPGCLGPQDRWRSPSRAELVALRGLFR